MHQPANQDTGPQELLPAPSAPEGVNERASNPPQASNNHEHVSCAASTGFRVHIKQESSSPAKVPPSPVQVEHIRAPNPKFHHSPFTHIPRAVRRIDDFLSSDTKESSSEPSTACSTLINHQDPEGDVPIVQPPGTVSASQLRLEGFIIENIWTLRVSEAEYIHLKAWAAIGDNAEAMLTNMRRFDFDFLMQRAIFPTAFRPAHPIHEIAFTLKDADQNHNWNFSDEARVYTWASYGTRALRFLGCRIKDKYEYLWQVSGCRAAHEELGLYGVL